jgi:hypothetical protein
MSRQVRATFKIIPLVLAGLILWLVYLLPASNQLLFAQDQPTLAPTKTPTSQQTELTNSSTTRIFSQADLTLLTGNIQKPNGIFWLDNHLYISCNGDFTIYQLDDTDGTTMAYIAGVRNAYSLYGETSSDGNPDLWIPDYRAKAILHIQNGHVVTTVSGFDGPWGIAYLDETHFFVTDLPDNSLYIISRFGDKDKALDSLNAPAGVASDGEYVYVANYRSRRRSIEWYRIADLQAIPEPETTPDAANLVSGLQNTTDLALGSDGNLYFAYSLGTRGVVGKVNPTVCRENGGCSNDEIDIVLFTDLLAPLAGLTIRPDLRLYIHTMFDPSIYWLDLARG